VDHVSQYREKVKFPLVSPLQGERRGEAIAKPTKPKEKEKAHMKNKIETIQPERKSPDLSDRLRSFTADMTTLAASLPEDRAGARVADTILNQSLAAYYAHGQAEGSPSAKEFTEKFRETLEQLRLLRRTLYLLQVMALPCDGSAVTKGLEDADILVRIFFSSIRTLTSKAAA
jgi:hypothetical protein